MQSQNQAYVPPYLHGWTAMIGVCLALLPSVASAFGGFFVGEKSGSRIPSATIVMMRHEATTAVSIRPERARFADRFAVVIPVPATFGVTDAKVIPHRVFDRVERLAAPRISQYTERDPCHRTASRGHHRFQPSPPHSAYRWVETAADDASAPQLEASEYTFTRIDGRDAPALRAWFDAHELGLPEGAEEHLRPYVARGMHFLIAYADLTHHPVQERRPRPIRLHFESDDFHLATSISRVNSAGRYRLTVYVLAADQRYAVANRPHVTVPTSLTVAAPVFEQFDAFYGNLRALIFSKTPQAVITEFAGPALGCKSCSGQGLTIADLKYLGADVALEPRSRSVIDLPTPTVTGSLTPEAALVGMQAQMPAMRRCISRQAFAPLGEMRVRYSVAPDGSVRDPKVAQSLGDDHLDWCLRSAIRGLKMAPADSPSTIEQRIVISLGPPALSRRTLRSFVLTRLHLQTGRESSYDDLILEARPPIAGGYAGRNRVTQTKSNLFSARYAVRRWWTGPLDCFHHNRGLWRRDPDVPMRVSLNPQPERHRTLPLRMAVPGGISALGIEPW